MKTPAIQEPVRPLWMLETEARGRYERARQDWEADQLVAEERSKVVSGEIRKALKDERHGNSKELARALITAADPHPARRRYIVNDSTVEKLGELLNENPYGLLVFRDEITGLLRMLDKEGHEGARAFYLEAWNGTQPFTYDRIGRGTIDIEAACLSVLGGIQPGPLTHYLRAVLEDGLGDDGLMQRFQLLVWPDVSLEWKDVDRWPDTAAKQAAYDVFIRLSGLNPEDIEAKSDEAGAVPYLHFAPDAQELFTEWRSALEPRLRRGDEPPALEAHLAKYRSLVPSLALLIHLADGGTNPVGLMALERACAWADYLEAHARRIYSPILSPDDVAVRALASRILKGDLARTFGLKDVYRPHWTHLRSRADAIRAVDILVDLDWLRVQIEDTGGRRRQRFLVNPRTQGLTGEVA
jgi:hypothetical protein